MKQRRFCHMKKKKKKNTTKPSLVSLKNPLFCCVVVFSMTDILHKKNLEIFLLLLLLFNPLFIFI